MTKADYTKKIFMKKDDQINIFVKKINLETDLDFIILGSKRLPIIVR